jgi:hypothetical protein
VSAPSFRRFNPDAYLQTLGGEAAKAAKVARVDPTPAVEGKTLAGLATLERAPSWCATDWRVLFDERAATLEFDHHLARPEAEARAFECCLVEWMNRSPAPSAPGWCAGCGKPEAAGAIVVPFGCEGPGHTWLHPGCWPAWHKRRRFEAEAALAALGLKP